MAVRVCRTSLYWLGSCSCCQPLAEPAHLARGEASLLARRRMDADDGAVRIDGRRRATSRDFEDCIVRGAAKFGSGQLVGVDACLLEPSPEASDGQQRVPELAVET